jgi:hypothetical protein
MTALGSVCLRRLGQSTTITTLALSVLAMVAATIALPPTAQADPSYPFQSPSGNIFCLMGVGNDGKGSVVGGGPYRVPEPPEFHQGWGDRFSTAQGSAGPEQICHAHTATSSDTRDFRFRSATRQAAVDGLSGAEA